MLLVTKCHESIVSPSPNTDPLDPSDISFFLTSLVEVKKSLHLCCVDDPVLSKTKDLPSGCGY